jgi:hypothetical protein
MDDYHIRDKKVFKCPNCNKSFKYYSRLQKHLDRKTPCNPVITIKDDDRFENAKKERRVCEFCNRTFKSNQTMKIHLKKNCPIAPTGKNGIVGIEILNKHLESNIKAVGQQQSESVGQQQSESVGQQQSESVGQQQSESVGQQQSNSVGQQQSNSVGQQQSVDINGNNNITNINSNNNTYNNIYNITIQVHGNENLSYITEDDVASIFNSSITKKMINDIAGGDLPSIDAAVNEILRKLVADVYNNKLHPENYNMFITSNKEFLADKKIMTYKKDGWSLEDCTDVYSSITNTIIHKLIQYKHPMYTTYTPVIDKIIRVKAISEKLLYPVITKVKLLLEEYGLLPFT